MYSSLNFDKCTYPCNDHHKQGELLWWVLLIWKFSYFRETLLCYIFEYNFYIFIGFSTSGIPIILMLDCLSSIFFNFLLVTFSVAFTHYSSLFSVSGIWFSAVLLRILKIFLTHPKITSWGQRGTVLAKQCCTSFFSSETVIFSPLWWQFLFITLSYVLFLLFLRNSSALESFWGTLGQDILWGSFIGLNI